MEKKLKKLLCTTLILGKKTKNYKVLVMLFVLIVSNILSVMYGSFFLSQKNKSKLQEGQLKQTSLITNKKDSRLNDDGEVKRSSWDGDVYDLSFVAYDKEFADEFGLKTDLVTQMDKGLRFMEAKMITEGARTNCYYNLVLDKDVEVAFPEGKNYFLNNNPTIDINVATVTLPDQNDPSYQKKVNLMKKKKSLFRNSTIDVMLQYNNRLYVGTQDYQEGKPRARSGASVNYYIQDRLNYKILSIYGYCSLDANVFEIPNAGIWVAKDNLDYNTMVRVKYGHFNRFLIPESITNKIRPIILEYRDRAREIMNNKNSK